MNNLAVVQSSAAMTGTHLDIAQSQDFDVFYKDFEAKVAELQAAMSKTRSTRDLADSLSKRGTMSMFFGTFSGRNDKDLAKMVKELGISLETTQVMLQLVMKAQHAKNHFLRAFHTALVEKIFAIQSDTSVLDSNQRDAAVVIIGEIRDHVASQIRQQELVDSHHERLHQFEGVLNEKIDLDDFKDFALEKNQLDSVQDQKLVALECSAVSFLEADRAQQELIAQLQSAHASKDELDRMQTHRIDLLTAEIARLDLEGQRQDRSLGTAESQIAIATARIDALERLLADSRRAPAIAKRHALGIMGLVLAATALWF